MPTAFQFIYQAAKNILSDINTDADTTVTQAPTNYGTDFRITPGEARYQVQVSPVKDYARSSNDNHPRAVVVVLIHHYASSLYNEETFTFSTMQIVSDKLLSDSIWAAESGVFGLQHDLEPEISDGERTGNVITFEIEASVLADAA
jgi:hypothetical protein